MTVYQDSLRDSTGSQTCGLLLTTSQTNPHAIFCGRVKIVPKVAENSLRKARSENMGGEGLLARQN